VDEAGVESEAVGDVEGLERAEQAEADERGVAQAVALGDGELAQAPAGLVGEGEEVGFVEAAGGYVG